MVKCPQKTNGEGKLTFDRLVPGWYKLEETDSPAGYIKSEGHLFPIENIPGAALAAGAGLLLWKRREIL